MNIIVVREGNKSRIPIIVYNRQPDGLYIQHLQNGNKLKCELTNIDKEIIISEEIVVSDSEPALMLDGNIPKGYYFCNIWLTDNNSEKFLIVQNKIINVN